MMESKEVQGTKREGKEVKPFPEREHYEQIQRKLNRGVIFLERYRDEGVTNYAVGTKNLP
jgi:hypothetical protein